MIQWIVLWVDELELECKGGKMSRESENHAWSSELSSSILADTISVLRSSSVRELADFCQCEPMLEFAI